MWSAFALVHAELAAEAIARGIVTSISPDSIGRFLREADLKPHRVRSWINTPGDAQFDEKCRDACETDRLAPERAAAAQMSSARATRNDYNRITNRTIGSTLTGTVSRRRQPMSTLTANDLKTRGVSAVEARLKEDDEVIISVRGKERYVIVDIEKYAQMREYELAAALQEAKADLDAGRYTTESVAEHMQRVSDEL
ncbi:type II toxin-antitoxin system prevent-host-death family antitoxin [Thiohalocapsa marina]|uniref:type II toxin-antitoxin system prevent-host-death family antitoxin n=1 Tax=Thiohalocapsa marina TaxID=424902 RepID=UPI0036DCA8C6